MSGAAKKTKKKKEKRQQVRRHYKPSLGRHVDNYKRTGENAQKKTKGARPTCAKTGSLPSPPPQRRRTR